MRDHGQEILHDRGSEPDPGQRERATALHMKLLETVGSEVRPGSYSSAKVVSFMVAATAGLDVKKKLEFLQIDDESDRLRFLIDHLRQLIPRVQDARDRERKVSSNGHFKGAN